MVTDMNVCFKADLKCKQANAMVIHPIRVLIRNLLARCNDKEDAYSFIVNFLLEKQRECMTKQCSNRTTAAV